ncbi:ABC transporter permease [Sphingosinicella sp.]|uniref:ABC transporter permease n=1 Tax=Sphingosinicella sp. TaxID=1917971 RepID=UPI0035B36B60
MSRTSFLGLRHANASVGTVLFGLALTAALIGTVATPYDPIALDFGARLSPPSAMHWLGTDQFGRDVFSRLLSAASVSLLVSFLAVLLAMVIGISIGALSGYFGGWVDRLVMMLADALMALPGLLLALALVAALGQSKWGVILALGLAYAPSVTRVMRGVALSLREKEFVEASRAMGNAEIYTIARHVIPNSAGSLTVLATAFFSLAILAESALSFLGLGVPPPYPSWGGMLADARSYFTFAPWLAIFPGLAISMTLLGINLLGDALRDHFDPRMARA